MLAQRVRSFTGRHPGSDLCRRAPDRSHEQGFYSAAGCSFRIALLHEVPAKVVARRRYGAHETLEGL